MNKQYKRARNKRFLIDEKKAAEFSDWSLPALIGFGFSLAGLWGWFPGSLLCLVLEIGALIHVKKSGKVGLRLSVCGTIFCLLGCFMAISSGIWKEQLGNIPLHGISFLILCLFSTAVVAGGMALYYFFKARKNN